MNAQYGLNNRLVLSALVAIGLLSALEKSVEASPGTEVFQGFTQYISAQIGKDKQAFAQADTCTAWFYKQMGKKPPPAAQLEKIHFCAHFPIRRCCRLCETISQRVGVGPGGFWAYPAKIIF